MSQPTLTLYNNQVSSYAQKVRIALREKKLDFQAVDPLGLPYGTIDPEFAKANPRGEVPVLRVSNDPHSTSGPFTVVDSRVIVQYLEDRFPETSLFPADAASKARAREIEQVMDAQYEAINWGWGEVLWMKRAEGSLAEHVKAEVQRQTGELQSWLESRLQTSGWLTGPDFGVADIAASVIVNRSAHYGFAPASGSKLGQWLERVRGRDSVRATFAEFDASVGNMSKFSDVFLSGQRKREYRDYRLEFLVKSGAIQIVQEGLKNNNIRFPWPDGKL